MDTFSPVMMGSNLPAPQNFQTMAQAHFTFPPQAHIPAPVAQSSASFNPSGSFQIYSREQQHFQAENPQPVLFHSASKSMEDDENEEVVAAEMVGATSSQNMRAISGSTERPALDKLVGACTSDIYSNMKKIQHKHHPGFQPDSPYVKYRRCPH
jgi:hypothetical protein